MPSAVHAMRFCIRMMAGISVRYIHSDRGHKVPMCEYISRM